jgi:hypothetical protein
MMHIIDLDHLEVPIGVSEDHETSLAAFIHGAASAAITGYAYTDTNYAAAALFAGASGQSTLTYANTSAVTSLYPSYSTSAATASGYAIGVSPGSYAKVSYNASANNTSFNGTSSNMSSSITMSTYRTR